MGHQQAGAEFEIDEVVNENRGAGPRSLGRAIRQPEQRATGLSIDTMPTVTTATGTRSCRVGSVRGSCGLDAALTVRCGES